MARIKHPRPQIGTIVDRLGGVIFRDGYAEVDLTDKPNLAAAYEQHGYVVEAALTTDDDLSGLLEASEAAGDILDLESLTRPQLQSLARIRSVDVPKRATKADLVDLISRAPAEPIADLNAEQMPPYIVPLTADED